MTPVSPSMLFEQLERYASRTIERHEVVDPVFGRFRSNIRQIVVKLNDPESDVAVAASSKLRTMLSECLTAPLSFDSTLFDVMSEALGVPKAVESRWGSDIAYLDKLARDAIEDLRARENTLRVTLSQVIHELKSSGQTFKIFCHRRARPHFESILSRFDDIAVSEGIFLHSLFDYSRVAPFEKLIKVGPLRARGWGSAPDALLTAPRFTTLVQIVWFGCKDEPDFGYDPIASSKGTSGGIERQLESTGPESKLPIGWSISVLRSAEAASTTTHELDMDDLQIFRELDRPSDKRLATLIQVDQKNGILFPPHSRVLSFSNKGEISNPFTFRVPGETLQEGMYVILPVIHDVDLGGIQAKHGEYSEIWKAQLRKAYESEPGKLISKLRAAGLDLVNLSAAIRHWCNAPTTVIHAPQQAVHFQILLNVLGIQFEAGSGFQRRPMPYWQLAWNEVRRSRGEAIQAGFQEHEIVEEQLISVLDQLLPLVRESARTEEGFTLEIPDGHGLNGAFLFFKACGIEEGFNAPTAEIKVVRELQAIDQWRN